MLFQLFTLSVSIDFAHFRDDDIIMMSAPLSATMSLTRRYLRRKPCCSCFTLLLFISTYEPPSSLLALALRLPLPVTIATQRH